MVSGVSKEADMRALAARAIEAFDGFDTWINDAGVRIYGRVEENRLEDMRQLFKVNFGGIFHGSRVALPHLNVYGGALINLGSEVSDRAVPLQGMCCVSEHAIKGFTEALQMELEAEKAPVSATLIKPGQIDTLFMVNAKNQLAGAPMYVPPVYASKVVAWAILHYAQTPARDVFVGGGVRGMSPLGHVTPWVTDRLMGSSALHVVVTLRAASVGGAGRAWRSHTGIA